MAIHLDRRIGAFQSLREQMIELTDEQREQLFRRAEIQNPWFTPGHLDLAWQGIIQMLDPDELSEWSSKYELAPEKSMTVGIVMAGNIPMVGFHDLLSVLIAGHKAAVKMSSQDEVLILQLMEWLCEAEPVLNDYIERRELLKDIDAVIATGSDNSARYFHYYFGKMPHIIRKNRTSIAVLEGNESKEEIKGLGHDIYAYFGLGCRNVSKVYVPREFDVTSLFPTLEGYQVLIDHHKYKNNYDYNKSIYLVNKDPHLDTGFGLWIESEELVSPISVTYIGRYDHPEDVTQLIEQHEEKLQCVVRHGGGDAVPFGGTQAPKVWDYADKVDTLSFLTEL